MRTDILRYAALMLLLTAGCNKKQPDDMMPPLHRAVVGGDVNEVQLLLRQGADINAKDTSGRTALSIAASGGRLWSTPASLRSPGCEMLRFLLDNGANINATDKWGYSVLHAALNKGLTDVAELLLARGAYVQTQSRGGETPLHVAARDGWPKLVKLLVAKGAEVNVAAHNGDTPLLCAIIRDTVREYDRYPLDPNHLEMVRFLIAKGADVNAMNRVGETPLSRAAKAGDLKLAQLLVDGGAQPDRTATPDGTPAILAMNRNHMDVVKFLVARGAEVTLHLAAYVGDLPKAQALIQSGRDVNARGHARETPLHMAVCGGHCDLAELLVNSGADVNAQATIGWTPLHEAAWQGLKGMAELLITRGASVNAKTTEDRSSSYFPRAYAPPGTTPLHVAPKEVVEVLIAKGADIDAKDEMGDTPVRRAVFVGDRHVVDLLVEAGADMDLHLAAYTGRAERVKRLIEAGSDVNALDGQGRMPLYSAVIGGHADVVELLVGCGANPNATYDEGYGHYGRDQIPLHKAAQMDYADVARVLITHGANVRARNSSGDTPLHAAAYFGSTSVVEVLLAHGADPNARIRYGETALDYAQEAGFADVARLLGGDAGKLARGPYRVIITDPNAIRAFVGRDMPVDEVWIPDETQLREFEIALKTHLRENAAPDSANEHVLTHLRRYHREYGGLTSRGKRYIICNLSLGEPDMAPPDNHFTRAFDTSWGMTHVIFDAESKTVVRVEPAHQSVSQLDRRGYSQRE